MGYDLKLNNLDTITTITTLASTTMMTLTMATTVAANSIDENCSSNHNKWFLLRTAYDTSTAQTALHRQLRG